MKKHKTNPCIALGSVTHNDAVALPVSLIIPVTVITGYKDHNGNELLLARLHFKKQLEPDDDIIIKVGKLIVNDTMSHQEWPIYFYRDHQYVIAAKNRIAWNAPKPNEGMIGLYQLPNEIVQMTTESLELIKTRFDKN